MEKKEKQLQNIKKFQNLLLIVIIIGAGVLGFLAGGKTSEDKIANLETAVLAEQRKGQIALDEIKVKITAIEAEKASIENLTKIEIYTKISNYLDKEINPVGKTAEVVPTPAVEEPKK